MFKSGLWLHVADSKFVSFYKDPHSTELPKLPEISEKEKWSIMIMALRSQLLPYVCIPSLWGRGRYNADLPSFGIQEPQIQEWITTWQKSKLQMNLTVVFSMRFGSSSSTLRKFSYSWLNWNFWHRDGWQNGFQQEDHCNGGSILSE